MNLRFKREYYYVTDGHLGGKTIRKIKETLQSQVSGAWVDVPCTEILEIESENPVISSCKHKKFRDEIKEPGLDLEQEK